MAPRATNITTLESDVPNVDEPARALPICHSQNAKVLGRGIASTGATNQELFPLEILDPREVLVLKSLPREGDSLLLSVSEHLDAPSLNSGMIELLAAPKIECASVLGDRDPLKRLRALLSDPTLAGGIFPKRLLDKLLGTDEHEDVVVLALRNSVRIVIPLSAKLPFPAETTRDLALDFHSPRESADGTHDSAAQKYDELTHSTHSVMLRRSFGDVVWRKPAGSTSTIVSLERRAVSLPKAASQDLVWPPAKQEGGEFERESLHSPMPHLDPSVGLIISKAEALPRDWEIPNATVVLVPGTTTWRKLTHRNVWVHGSFDGLGEDEFTALAASFPEVKRWIKLGHTGAVPGDNAELLPTYRLISRKPAPDVTGYTHFFWKSGSQFEYFLRSNPCLHGAYHGSGPGHTHTTIVRHLGESSRVGVFLGIDDFREQVL